MVVEVFDFGQETIVNSLNSLWNSQEHNTYIFPIYEGGLIMHLEN